MGPGEIIQHHDPDETPEMRSRRKFLSRLTVVLGGVSAVAVGVPVAGFILGPLFKQSPQAWQPVGDTTQFKVGETVQVNFDDASPLPWAGVTARQAAWLRRNSTTTFTAFAVNCSHLGCPVTWIPTAKLFMCPCHGGVYYADGTVAGGPPPSPLSTYEVRVNAGKVEIRTSDRPLVTEG